MSKHILIKKVLCIFIAVLFILLINDAQASEQQQAGANTCEISVLVAYKAYLWETSDAKYPDFKRLNYAVDYMSDMEILKHDKSTSLRAVDYIAKRLKPVGMRLPDQYITYEAAREFMVKECLNK